MSSPDDRRPGHNPYRCASNGVGYEPRAAGLSLDDVLAVAASREHAGFAAGYRERDKVAAGHLENAYDRGWHAGMLEQVVRLEPLGTRLEVLRELLRLLADDDEGLTTRDVAELAAAVIWTVSEDALPPFGRIDERGHPTAALVAPVGEAASALREWLRPYLDRARHEAAPE